MSIAADRIDLSDHEAELLAQASRLMSEALDRSEARRIALVEEKADGSDIARLEVPPATLRLISQILALIAGQQTFVLYPESSELTTKQAAEVVGVSRPFLIRVLEAGEIPYRKVGRHRRVLMKDVLAYKEKCRSRVVPLWTNSSSSARKWVGTISDGALRSIHGRVGRVHDFPDAAARRAIDTGHSRILQPQMVTAHTRRMDPQSRGSNERTCNRRRRAEARGPNRRCHGRGIPGR
jgi:excisionase family DNA binding protein